ncbi:hypothetical protein L6164_002941 [Bauhinia variegata]|uniref:Uncharacterized protein n=1 Tax=Bauhinia variegata TaxID=167791 RepID=A0ACB9PZS8_BAUVA|nr:hypothetical protein L6164_002941 [Bauhinia variegata]
MNQLKDVPGLKDAVITDTNPDLKDSATVQIYGSKEVTDVATGSKPINLDFSVVAIGSGYFIIKFANTDQLFRVATGGPWFVQGVKISMQLWSPNFVCKNPVQAEIVWVRLPNLPIEYFDSQVLAEIGSSMGKFLQVDTRSVNGDRGRFSRLCLQIDDLHNIPTEINIDGFFQD